MRLACSVSDGWLRVVLDAAPYLPGAFGTGQSPPTCACTWPGTPAPRPPLTVSPTKGQASEHVTVTTAHERDKHRQTSTVPIQGSCCGRTGWGRTYLLWNHNRVRHELLLGGAVNSHRAQHLAGAWSLIHHHALFTPGGRQTWSRNVSPPQPVSKA